MTKETKIGLVVFVVVVVCSVTAFFFNPLSLIHKNYYEVNAVFSDAQGLKDNAQVLYAGVYVGNVHGITVKDGQAVVHLRIDKKNHIPRDAQFTITSNALVGDLIVAISGGTPGSEYLQDGATVKEYKSDKMDKLMEKAGKLLQSVEETQKNVEKMSS